MTNDKDKIAPQAGGTLSPADPPESGVSAHASCDETPSRDSTRDTVPLAAGGTSQTTYHIASRDHRRPDLRFVRCDRETFHEKWLADLACCRYYDAHPFHEVVIIETTTSTRIIHQTWAKLDPTVGT